MRNVDRIILRTLSLAFATGGLVVACSSGGGEPGAGTDAGTGEVPEGGTVGDGAANDSAPPPQTCAKNEECPSGVCNLATKLCEAPTCKDGVRNAAETDLDCGGDCPKCDQLKACKVAADCTTGVCKDTGTGLKCQPPTNTDGVKNGIETGIDCGGTGNPKCADGQGCKAREDCTSDYCKANVCTAILPGDGVQNGTETDVDCGGAGNARCDDALKCLADADCKSDVCKDTGDGMGLRCQAPTFDDGKKNGTETDVDCGGNPAYPCATGKSCLVNDDCSSLGCNYLKKCAAGRSCTARYGGDTCGFGGDGSVGAAAWEDCCATAPVTPTSGPTAGVPVQLGKYQVTAGRMRVFLESVGYDVRTFVKNARAAGKIPVIPGNAQGRTVLEADWDMYLPTSFAGNTNAPPNEIADCAQGSTTTATGNVCKPNTEQNGIYTSVRNHLGGIIFKGNDQTLTGCFVGGGTHAFRFPDGQQDGNAPAYSQDVYDTKSMQCIPYLVAQAFCVWDGGRLELGQEWVAAWGGGAMPWQAETARTPQAQGSSTYSGCRFPTATDAAHGACGIAWDTAVKTIEYANYQYSYQYPVADPPTNGDYIVFISAPGRTRGRGPNGHADIIGNNYGLTSNVVYNADPFVATHGWNASGSWEVHAYGKPASGQSRTSNLLNKYGKLGLRCAYPL